MDEFVEVTDADFQSPLELDWNRFNYWDSDKLLLVDVGDLFEEMETWIRAHGEIPIHDRHESNTQWFMEEIYNAVCFLPGGKHYSLQNIESVLQSCATYFDALAFTPVQRHAWYGLTRNLVERFRDFKLYNHRFENRYDYYCLKGDTLVLKLFE